MKAVVLALLLFIAAAFATPARQISIPSFEDGKRTFQNPANDYELTVRTQLINTKLTNPIGATVRFSNTINGFQFALNDIVNGLFRNSFEWTNATGLETRFATLNIAAGLLAHNPVNAFLAREALLDDTKNFYVSMNASEHDDACATQTTVGSTGCYGSSYLRILSPISETNEGIAHRDFVYAIIDTLIAKAGANATDPLSGAQDSVAAASSHKSCYNKLFSIINNNQLPYDLIGNDSPVNCPVNYVNRAFQFCYDNAGSSSYEFQKDVPEIKKCNGTEGTGLASNCIKTCTPDGFCGNVNKCGFIYCVLDQDYCDYMACFEARSESTKTRVCCDLDADNYKARICPPTETDDTKDFLTCTSRPDGGVDCCDPSGNCQAAREIEVGSCFIATAAFGSSMNPNVWALRVFRDNYLLTNPLGRLFVNFYYTFSPAVADVIAQSDVLRAATRTLLTPIVAAVNTFF